MDQNFLRCTKILSQHHLFLSFLHNPFLSCEDTFMDDYMMKPIIVMVKNMVLLKYLTTFDSLFFTRIKI
jgi:hypothetical protein